MVVGYLVSLYFWYRVIVGGVNLILVGYRFVFVLNVYSFFCFGFLFDGFWFFLLVNYGVKFF